MVNLVNVSLASPIDFSALGSGGVVLRGTLSNDGAGTSVAAAGDVNNDGVFDSSDLVDIFRVGEYEDELEDNSTFADGDWNGDGDFDSSDFVTAFRAGTYSAAARPVRTGNVLAAVVDVLFTDEDGRRVSRQI